MNALNELLRFLALELSKKLLQLSINSELRCVLPVAFRRLDRELVYWQRMGASTRQVESALDRILADQLKRIPTPHEKQAIRMLYDPVLSAIWTGPLMDQYK